MPAWPDSLEARPWNVSGAFGGRNGNRCWKAGCLVFLLAGLESTKSESFAGPRRAFLATLPFFSWAKANAEVTIAPTQLPPRDARKDEEFAKGMAYGMVDYERAVSKKKRALFSKLWGLLPPNPVVVEVGIGSFPNALYFGSKSAPRSMDVVGIDPNEYMERYALENAKKVGLLEPERGNSFRFAKGIAEASALARAQCRCGFSAAGRQKRSKKGRLHQRKLQLSRRGPRKRQ